MSLKLPKLVAITGYFRVGKDQAALPLVIAGFTRVAVGDIIKRQLDALIQQHFGFTAFTEDDTRKKQIRPVLEAWGDANYGPISEEFIRTLPDQAVNPRLVRVTEAEMWHQRGGVIVDLHRVNHGIHSKPGTPWEAELVREMRTSGLVDFTVYNDGTANQLRETFRRLFCLPLNDEESLYHSGYRSRTVRCCNTPEPVPQHAQSSAGLQK